MTPKERMLAAYRGEKQAFTPVAPEFWNYYPAKLLGLPFDRFEREIPHWYGLKVTFEKFGCEGWGIALPEVANPRIRVKSEYIPYADHSREIRRETVNGREFVRVVRYMPDQLSFVEKRPVTDPEDVREYFAAKFSDEAEFDFRDAVSAHGEVGESFLLELFLGDSFFDAFEGVMGFENALFYFLEEDEEVLLSLREKYVRYMKRLVDGVAETPFESCFIGCSSACNSLLGPKLWRKWDKPFYKEIQKEDDLIITASPDFTMNEICKRLGIKYLLSTTVNKETGKFERICLKDNKLKSFFEFYGDAEIENFYTDSPENDYPLIDKAQHAFIVKGDKITQIK